MTSARPSLGRLATLQLIALAVLALSILMLATVSVSNRTALCAFKSDLETRIAANEELLNDSSDPIIRAYGLEVPRSVIESNVRGQKATLKSLDNLYLC